MSIRHHQVIFISNERAPDDSAQRHVEDIYESHAFSQPEDQLTMRVYFDMVRWESINEGCGRYTVQFDDLTQEGGILARLDAISADEARDLAADLRACMARAEKHGDDYVEFDLF